MASINSKFLFINQWKRHFLCTKKAKREGISIPLYAKGGEREGGVSNSNKTEIRVAFPKSSPEAKEGILGKSGGKVFSHTDGRLPPPPLLFLAGVAVKTKENDSGCCCWCCCCCCSPHSYLPLLLRSTNHPQALFFFSSPPQLPFSLSL